MDQGQGQAKGHSYGHDKDQMARHRKSVEDAVTGKTQKERGMQAFTQLKKNLDELPTDAAKVAAINYTFEHDLSDILDGILDVNR